MDDAQLIAQAEISPCVGVCKVDQITGWCFGCGRTNDEIVAWQSYNQTQRDDLLVPLADRVEQIIIRRRAERGGSRRRSRR